MIEKNTNKSANQTTEQGFYQTGRTQPEKSHTGLISFLLMLLILFGGMVAVLEVLEVNLFDRSDPEPGDLYSPMHFEHPNDGPENSHGWLPGSKGMELDESPTSVDTLPQSDGLSLQQIYKQNIPSVVSITCKKPAGTSSGTGVIIASDGFLVTNNHVIANAQSITVQLTDRRSFSAYTVGTDKLTDLAVLYIPAKDLTPARFGDSSVLQVGDTVVAIGDPLGQELRGTMTDGIVSAINRDITTGGRTLTPIQTNAALNSGNSGGPLLNCYGQVVGINTMKIGESHNASSVEGLGFAIPSTTVNEVVNQILMQGYVSGRPTLGFTGDAMSALERQFYGLPKGLYITDVNPNSSAYRAGIRPGDTLLQINGQTVTDRESLDTLVYGTQPGDPAKLLIYRDGWRYYVSITVEEAR